MNQQHGGFRILHDMTTLSVFIWIISSIGLFVTLQNKSVAPILLFVMLGSFMCGVIMFTLNYLLIRDRTHNKKTHIFSLILRFILSVPILPIYVLFTAFNPFPALYNMRSKRISIYTFFTRGLKKTFLIILIVVFFIPIWILGYAGIGYMGLAKLQYLDEPITISGTGSMYPTFPKGSTKSHIAQAKEVVGTPGMVPYPNGLYVFGKRYFNYEIHKGDIVVFENQKVRELSKKTYGSSSGFVKRVIGLPGDTIELREGLVRLNGTYLKEQYVARARSTFGGDFLPECKKISIPSGMLFVMGDNRKGSSDSRHEIGFIRYKDINHVFPYEKQITTLSSHWRNTSDDLQNTAKIKIDKQKYLSLLNIKRREVGAKPLRYEPKLEKSADLRAYAIFTYDDFSFEATKSGYTMQKAMEEAGYSNIVYGESPLQGYYEADELIENQFEFAENKAFLLNKDYQDFGIAEAEGTLQGCPTQIIVQQFAGYVPPNYKKEDIDSWKKILDNLKEIQPSWQKIKTYSEFYEKNKEDVDKINNIILMRMTGIQAIVVRMDANQWLTKEEESYLKNDIQLSENQNSLAVKLNNMQ